MTAPLWIFGYGSLIWDPGFQPAERVVARASGFRRSFCMWSYHYRGTEAVPGLVLALDAEAGAVCEGLALRVAPGQEARVTEDLRARELISHAYAEAEIPVTLADGRRVLARSYVIARDHPQYAPDLAPEDQARIIARARGDRGPNRDYLNATVDQLAALGLSDPGLFWLKDRVSRL